ncbi:unnamed protein product, partial [Prunus brigantina]
VAIPSICCAQLHLANPNSSDCPASSGFSFAIQNPAATPPKPGSILQLPNPAASQPGCTFQPHSLAAFSNQARTQPGPFS